MALVPPRFIHPTSTVQEEGESINDTCMSISPYTGEPYDPSWGYQMYPPGEYTKVWIQNMMLAIGQWIITLARNIAAFLNREDDDLDSIRSYSPYLKGYQPTDTPPHQSPPQSVSGIIPVSDSFQALAHSMYLMASAGKVSMVAKHEETEPYAPQPQYDDMVLAPADWQGTPYEDDLSEDDIQQIMMIS